METDLFVFLTSTKAGRGGGGGAGGGVVAQLIKQLLATLIILSLQDTSL